MQPRRIAIVGGGPGGLFTAWLLERSAPWHADVTIYEAEGRVGGKVLTPSFESAAVRYEAGAAELYDYSVVDEDPLREAVELLGLPTREIGGSAVVLDGHVFGTADDVRDHLGHAAHAALLAFDDRAKAARSPRRFYGSGFDSTMHDGDRRFTDVMDAVHPPAVRRYLDTMLRSDLATEPNRTSAGYGLDNYLMNDPAYMRLYCIGGGNEQLVQALAARVGATVRLHEPVTAIGRTADGRMRVASRRDGRPHEEAFDTVIVALPMAHLPRVRFEGSRLETAIAAHCAHHDHPAHYVRISILFDRPFWRRHVPDAFFMLDRFGGCCLYDESARDPTATQGVLGWLLAGSDALEACGRSDEELLALALDSLPASLGDGRSSFREGRVHRWPGAVSALPGGERHVPVDRRHQPEPVEHPDLFLVGDYLFDSTLNGVLDSATHVAGWVASRMADGPGGGA